MSVEVKGEALWARCVTVRVVWYVCEQQANKKQASCLMCASSVRAAHHGFVTAQPRRKIDETAAGRVGGAAALLNHGA